MVDVGGGGVCVCVRVCVCMCVCVCAHAEAPHDTKQTIQMVAVGLRTLTSIRPHPFLEARSLQSSTHARLFRAKQLICFSLAVPAKRGGEPRPNSHKRPPPASSSPIALSLL